MCEISSVTYNCDEWIVLPGGAKRTHVFSNNGNFVYFQYKKLCQHQKTCNKCSFDYLHLITQLRKIISERWRPSCRTHVRSLSSKFRITFICLRFLSLGLPQIKVYVRKPRTVDDLKSFHSRRNCTCATRNVSKCDVEL